MANLEEKKCNMLQKISCRNGIEIEYREKKWL